MAWKGLALSSKEKPATINIGFLGLLQLMFIALKLTGHITWSWWLVLIPGFISVGLFSVVFALLVCAEINKRPW